MCSLFRMCSLYRDLHTLLVDLGPFVNRVRLASGHFHTPQFVDFGLKCLPPPFQPRNLLAELKKKIPEKSAPWDNHYCGKHVVCKGSLENFSFCRLCFFCACSTVRDVGGRTITMPSASITPSLTKSFERCKSGPRSAPDFANGMKGT
jgi:hypothetical protein